MLVWFCFGSPCLLLCLRVLFGGDQVWLCGGIWLFSMLVLCFGPYVVTCSCLFPFCICFYSSLVLLVIELINKISHFKKKKYYACIRNLPADDTGVESIFDS
jgi:hypothetical protein